MLRQHIYLLRSEAIAQEVVEEEIVQQIRANEVFCLLSYIAVLICRRQLRRDRGIGNIEQGSTRRRGLCHILYEVSYKGLGD